MDNNYKPKRFEVRENGIFVGLKSYGLGINLNYEQYPEHTDWYIHINLFKYSITLVFYRQNIIRTY
jgi:hypothetical protein